MFDGPHHLTALVVALTLLTVYRLTRLVTTDVITDRPRSWLRREYEGWLVTLVHCPWCMSVWIAGPVVVMTVYAGEWWRWVMVGVAGSAVAGYLAEHE